MSTVPAWEHARPVSVEHAIRILEAKQRDMAAEDARPMPRDARVYAAGYAAASTVALLFGVDDGGGAPGDVVDVLRGLLVARPGRRLSP